MRKIILLILVSFVIAGCSKNIPSPLGEELLWSSNGKKSRPEWTLKANTNQGQIFVGQSLFHSTERSAIRNAELDAGRQIALAERQTIETKQSESMNASSSERLILNADVKTQSETVQSAGAEISGAKNKEVYLERWRVDNETLWKAFVMVQKDTK